MASATAKLKIPPEALATPATVKVQSAPDIPATVRLAAPPSSAAVPLPSGAASGAQSSQSSQKTASSIVQPKGVSMLDVALAGIAMVLNLVAAAFLMSI